MEKIRLAIIDDYPIVGMGIKFVIQKCKTDHLELCAVYSTGEAALMEISPNAIDVILVDMRLPDITGVELIAKLLDINPTFKIGVYSSVLEKNTITKAFDNGAMGYLSKSADCKEIVEFVTTLAKGEMYIRGEIAKMMVNHTKLPSAAQKHIQLTPRECDVYKLVVGGLKTKEIATKLHICERTVEFHKQNIYQKYGVSDALNLTAVGNRMSIVNVG